MTLAPDQLAAFAELRERLKTRTIVPVIRRLPFTCAVGHPASEQRVGRNGQRECRGCAREARRRRRRRNAASQHGVTVLGAPRHVLDQAAALGIRRPVENLVEESLRAGDLDHRGLVRLHVSGRLLADVARCRSPLTHRPAYRIRDLHTGAPSPNPTTQKETTQ